MCTELCKKFHNGSCSLFFADENFLFFCIRNFLKSSERVVLRLFTRKNRGAAYVLL